MTSHLVDSGRVVVTPAVRCPDCREDMASLPTFRRFACPDCGRIVAVDGEYDDVREVVPP